MRKINEFLKTRLEAAKKNQKGFSLVELIIVIAILGVIAAIAMPNITKALDRSRRQADISNAKTIAHAVAILEAEQVGKSGITKEVDAEAVYTELGTLTEVKNELNSMPVVKLVTGGKFYVRIDKDGNISVGIGTTVGTSGETPISSDIKEVYPDPDSPWEE